MANTIQIKRKTTTGAPALGSLSDGEFCLNTVDSILYLRVNGTTLLEFPLSSDIPTPTTGSGTTLDLSNRMGTYYNMATASTDTSFSITGSALGGFAKVRTVGAASEPTVTGATKIAGATWNSTDEFYLVVEYNGNAAQFYFLKADNA